MTSRGRLVTDLDPGLIAALYRPNGTPVSDTDADVTRSGQSGPLNYWMSVRAGVNPEADPLRFQGFDFLGQDDGADGYTPVDGMPVVGVAALARAIITRGRRQRCSAWWMRLERRSRR
jgi:hypothetical protein